MKRSSFGSILGFKLVKFTLIGMLVLVVLLFSANMIWRYSGSNEWVFEMEKDGIEVYSMKTPGSDLLKFKGVVRFKSTLAGIVDSMNGTQTDDCDAWIPGCVSVKSVEPWNPEARHFVHLWTVNMQPFDIREYLLKVQTTQDPATKEVLMEFMAVPDMLPGNDCCVRVEHMHNKWKFRPLGNGEVELVFTSDMDLGGFFPDILYNKTAAYETYKIVGKAPVLLTRKEYQNSRYDFIEELASN